MLQSMILPSPLQTLHFLAIFQHLIFQNQQQAASKKVDFESLDSIPSMLSDRSDLAFQPGSSGHISDHMNRHKLFIKLCSKQQKGNDKQKLRTHLRPHEYAHSVCIAHRVTCSSSSRPDCTLSGFNPFF